jgi:tetratricopeptide (TPR) repeat protein
MPLSSDSGVELTAEGAAADVPGEDSAAAVHDGRIRGDRYLEAGYSEDSPVRAREFFEHALDAFRIAWAADRSDLLAILGRGQAEFALGRFDQARASFDRASRIDEENAEAHWGSALALLRLEHLDDAIPRLRRVTELNPRFERAWIVLGETLVRQEDYEGASEVLERARDANPQNSEILSAYGAILAELGQAEDALTQFEQSIGAARGRPDSKALAMMRAGMLQIELENPRAAVDHFEDLVHLAPELSNFDPSMDVEPLVAAAHYGAGAGYLGLKRHDEAVARFADARRTHGSMAIFGLTAQVGAFRDIGRYERAWRLLGELSDALEESNNAGLPVTDPGIAQVYGPALRLLGRHSDAVAVYRDAIHRIGDLQTAAGHADDASLRAQLVATYLEQRDLTPAILPSGNLEPNDLAQSNETRAKHFGNARAEFARTEQLFRDALEIKRNGRNLVALGGLLVLVEQDQAAQPFLLEAVQVGQEQRVASTHLELAHAYLGVTYSRSGEYAKAAREFDEALRSDPDNLAYRISRAEAYLRMGRPDVAEGGYRSVLEIGPGNVEGRIGLAEALAAQGGAGESGKYDLAEPEYQAAIDLAIKSCAPDPRLREGSTTLNRRKLATVYYARGYVLVKLYETETERGLLRQQGPRYLSKALESFQDALRMDPAHPQAATAIDRVRQEQWQRRSTALLGSWLPLSLAGICAFLILIVNLFFFVPLLRETLGADFKTEVTPGSYAMLVLGLLVLLIASVSLPQLLKLKVPGVALEKAAVEQPKGPAQLEIGRGQELAGLVPMKLPDALSIDSSRPRKDAPDVSASEGSTQLSGKRFSPEGRAASEDAQKGRPDPRPK